MTLKEIMAARRTRNRRIVAMYKRGATLEAVGRAVGLTGTAVMFVLKAAGVPRRSCWDYPHARRRDWKAARRLVERVAPLYGTRRGTTLQGLAKRIGRHPDTVRKHLRELGVKIRGGGWPQKLDDEKVRRLKIDLNRQELSFTDLAVKYGVSRSIIGGIAMGRKWKHVPWPTKAGYYRRGQGNRPASWKLRGTVMKPERKRPGVGRRRRR
jgi:lambda repressor-like predicted transcriptional regulator